MERNESRSREFYSKQGARLRTIPLNDFTTDLPRALTPGQLDENEHTVYEARGLSRNLQSSELAVSFDVHVNQLSRPQGHLVTASFKLMLLDDDYRQILSAHNGKMRSNGIIVIDPILIRSQNEPYHIIDKLKRVYLVNNDSGTFGVDFSALAQNDISTKVSISA